MVSEHDEAGTVTLVVFDPLTQHYSTVDISRAARGDGGSVGLVHDRLDRVSGRDRGDGIDTGHIAREEFPTLGEGLWVGVDTPYLILSDTGWCNQAVLDSQDDFATDAEIKLVD